MASAVRTHIIHEIVMAVTTIITVLAEDVRHHVKEEEQKGGLFGRFKQALTDDEPVKVVDEFLATKAA